MLSLALYLRVVRRLQFLASPRPRRRHRVSVQSSSNNMQPRKIDKKMTRTAAYEGSGLIVICEYETTRRLIAGPIDRNKVDDTNGSVVGGIVSVCGSVVPELHQVSRGCGFEPKIWRCPSPPSATNMRARARTPVSYTHLTLPTRR